MRVKWVGKFFITFLKFDTLSSNSLKNQFMAGMNLASIKASYYENIQEYLSDLKVIDMDEAVEEVFAYFYIINNQLKVPVTNNSQENSNNYINFNYFKTEETQNGTNVPRKSI